MKEEGDGPENPGGPTDDTPTCGGQAMPTQPGGNGVGKWVCVDGEWKWKVTV